MSATVRPNPARSGGIGGGPRRVIGPTGPAYWLSAGLVAAAAASSLLTYLLPSVLRGTAAMNGSARGTALVVLLAGVPVLAGSAWMAARGSAAAVVTWLGSVAFLLYNSLMFAFATPANPLMLGYLAMLALSAWSAGAILRQADIPALAAQFSPKTPVRGIAVYMLAVVALNAAAWLARIIPAMTADGAPAFLRGTGLTTSVVYVQDLALWLPLLGAAAIWLWQRRPHGYALAGAGLVMWVLESLSICVDQWYGHAADPASPAASGAIVPAFAILAVIGLVPAGLLLHGLSGGSPSVRAAVQLPAEGRRGWPGWTLAAVTALTGIAAIFGGVQLLRSGYGMPLDWLAGTPVRSWALPGIALLAGVALPQLTTAVLIVLADRHAPAAGYLAGAALIAWIAVQLLILQHFFFLQPVIVLLGLTEITLARQWHRTGSSGARAGPERGL